jgi:hypothetical protein
MPKPAENPSSLTPRLWPIRGAIVAVVLFSFFAMSEAVEANLLPALFQSRTPDFFIYRSGAAIALRGESPYDPEKVQKLVAEQFPADKQLIENSAFFLPPATIPIYSPFAAMPYRSAKITWAIGLTLSAIAVLLILRTFGSHWPTGPIEQLLPAIILLNYLTLAIVELGQTGFLFVGCVAAGQWCFERGPSPGAGSRKRLIFYELLGSFLWAIPFIKPHLALCLLPLAWYLGGWKRLVLILALVAALNIAGCSMIGRSPLFLWEYVQYLGSTHKAIIFNRVEESTTITSWNRLLFALGGPLVELSAVTTLAGYLVWFGLAAGRVSLSGKPPSAAWAAAVSAVGGVFCSQVLIYELLVLLLVIPWVRDLFAIGYRNRAWLTIGLICLQLIPVGAMANYGIKFHAPLGVALLAVMVMVGPCSSDVSMKTKTAS